MSQQTLTSLIKKNFKKTIAHNSHNPGIFADKRFFVSPNIRKLGVSKPQAFWLFDGTYTQTRIV